MEKNFRNNDLNFDTEKISNYDEQEIRKMQDIDDDGDDVFYLDINDETYIYYDISERDYDYDKAVELFKNSITEID